LIYGHTRKPEANKTTYVLPIWVCAILHACGPNEKTLAAFTANSIQPTADVGVVPTKKDQLALVFFLN